MLLILVELLIGAELPLDAAEIVVGDTVVGGDEVVVGPDDRTAEVVTELALDAFATVELGVAVGYKVVVAYKVVVEPKSVVIYEVAVEVEIVVEVVVETDGVGETDAMAIEQNTKDFSSGKPRPRLFPLFMDVKSTYINTS